MFYSNSCSIKHALVVLLVLNVGVGKCANILAVFPSPGYSQYILAEPLLVALAERGHNVTVISVFETKNVSNLRNILVRTSEVEDATEGLLQLQENSIFSNIRIVHELGLSITENVLKDKNVQKLIHSSETFDLVLTETFFNEAFQTFAKHFNAHQVLFHSMAINEWNSHLVANPFLPSYLPTSFAGYTNHMTYIERFKNFWILIFDRFVKYFIQYPAQQFLVDKYFPHPYNLKDIIYNASLMLTSSHVSTSEAIPLTASVIEVGGLHIVKRDLPRDVKEFLDSAKDGAIFFSLGSNVKTSGLSKKLIGDLLTLFGKLKQRVLWKFETDKRENMPANVMVSKWFPQNDILAHPNTVLFISHCGMGSTTETIYHGVPVIGIPLYGDQFMNLRRMVLYKMGRELPFKKLSGGILEDAIQEILNDPTYAKNAKKWSNIIKDRLLKPLDLAIYWIEYVLKHNGAHHLKNSILDMTWYQLYLIDVVGSIIFALLFATLLISVVILKYFKRQASVKPKNE